MGDGGAMVVQYGGWRERELTCGSPGCEMERTWLYNMGMEGTLLWDKWGMERIWGMESTWL